ncbi:MAG: hypothetical protein AAGG01_11960 [Planctomycetota bacterium]
MMAPACVGVSSGDRWEVGQDPPSATSLSVASLTYGTAQQVRWLDHEQFVVCRWDGTITRFMAPQVESGAARLVEALAVPGGEGVRMIEPRDGTTFVTSCTADSLAVWRRDPDGRFTPTGVRFPEGHGFAVSGLFVMDGDHELLVTGHESGSLLIWSFSSTSDPLLLRTVDLRLADPIDYLHDDVPLRHIRGLAAWRDGIVVAGGEDGGLHQVRLMDGKILSQTVFNRDARLGVNDLAVHGDALLVVNCALDRTDRNVWLFRLAESGFELRDSTNLLRDDRRDHVFAFDVLTILQGGAPLALITTKEGMLWALRFADGELRVTETLPLGRFDYGNAIDLEPSTRRLVAAGVGVRIVTMDGE